jgi:hypothetical protein
MRWISLQIKGLAPPYRACQKLSTRLSSAGWDKPVSMWTALLKKQAAQGIPL